MGGGVGDLELAFQMTVREVESDQCKYRNYNREHQRAHTGGMILREPGPRREQKYPGR
jgi:hypothetical protein